ncbi:MAG: RimK family protein [Wenzhouxiangellaceae bacterium]
MQWLMVVEKESDWPEPVAGGQTVLALDYLTEPQRFQRCRVINFCRSYRYQSIGYYVSLQAAARGHRPLPGVLTMQDLKNRSNLRLLAAGIDELIQSSLRELQSDEFELSIYFGQNMAKRYTRLARALFGLFPAPLLRARFQRRDDWQLISLRPIPLAEIRTSHREFLYQAADHHFAGRRLPARKHYRYDLAILSNPQESKPPSDERALRRFTQAAKAVGFAVQRLGPEDYGSVGEYDALFIRETTLVNHHTYRFARRAEIEGAVVIDDPDSILRCTNKVFLTELLQRQQIPTPRSMIVHRGMASQVSAQLGLPCVLKQPDGAFSQAVIKVTNEDELHQGLERFFSQSDLVLAQAYVPTDFDWRIGVLNGEPLYACRYYMARGHWQIINHQQKGSASEGNADTLPLDEVPANVLNIALKAARAVGNGLYGVDLKQFGKQCQVIEVNDNPSIDGGVEDKVLGQELYLRIMRELMRRVEQRKQGKS